MERKKEIRQLFERYLEGSYSEQQLQDMLAYFQVDISGNALEELIDEYLEQADLVEGLENPVVTQIVAQVDKVIYASIPSTTAVKSIKKGFHKYFWSYAAAAVLLVGSLSYGIFRYSAEPTEVSTLKSKFGDDVVSLGSKATLQLESGKIIDLEESAGGIVMHGNQVSYQDGKIYIAELDEAEPLQLTLATPNGTQYKVTLPDGSHVWLNAASSLEYPSRFSNTERSVKLSGEAYFEVEKDATRPFFVETDGQVVQVLGTSFNINAYGDRADQYTTLLEGRVRISTSSGKDVVLVPGQQAVQQQGKISVKAVDVNSSLGWKNGEFVFHYTSLHDILHELARWYDLEINFESIPNESFYAEVNREEPLSAVLTMLESTSNLTFEIKGRRLLVGQKDENN